MDYRTELATVTANTTVSQDTDIFASDFQVKRAGNLVRISIQATSALTMNLVPNTGSPIHLGALSANLVSTFELALDQGRTFNLQSGTAGDNTLEFCCIQEVQQ